jgi:hypothetical protein
VHAEQLGYERFWVAEHHGMPGITSSAPAVLLSAVGAATSTIRIGSGGVMLPNHAPLVVAEQFGTLRALYGDRVDLGLGRAPGTDGATAMALRRTDRLDVDDFPDCRSSGCSGPPATAPRSPVRSASRSPSPTTSRRTTPRRHSRCTATRSVRRVSGRRRTR